MLIKKIKIRQFRNYQDLEIDFSNKVNFIVGRNAQGKTNILEAVFLLVLTKSFRTQKGKDLVKWGEAFAEVSADIVCENNETSNLNLVITNENDVSKKKGKIDGIETKVIDFISNLNAVIFEPEDLNMITHEPADRRKYIDMAIAQVNNVYVIALAKYGKIIKVRNKLLSNIRDNLAMIDELAYWDGQILNFSSEIVYARKQMIKYYNDILPNIYKQISDDEKILTVKYETRTKMNEKEDIRKELRELLELSKLDDITQGRTTSGPHREDLSFYLDGKNIRTCGSRGEFRSIILALKVAEIEYIKYVTKRNPVLLLDDVFSELDPIRQKYLIKLIKNQQTILTTTEESYIKTMKQKDVNVIRIEEGKII